MSFGYNGEDKNYSLLLDFLQEFKSNRGWQKISFSVPLETGVPPGSDRVSAPCGRYFFREFESRSASVEISFSVPLEIALLALLGGLNE